MPSLLLFAKHSAGDAAMRGVIESLAGVDLAWDVQETSEALRLIEQSHPDAAIFSHNLMNAELLVTIRAAVSASPCTKILIVSMYNDSRFALRVIEAGARGYLLQDRVFEELENALRTILSGRTYLSPGIAGVERPVRGNGEMLGDPRIRSRSEPSALREGGEGVGLRTPRPQDSRGPARILVVDDDEFIRKMVRMTLEGAGYAVATVATGDEAIASLQDELPDLAFVDLLLPGASGVEVIRTIRELDETLPVVVITGYPDSDLMYQAMSYSPLLVLAKPVVAKMLLEAVRSVLAGRRGTPLRTEGSSP